MVVGESCHAQRMRLLLSSADSGQIERLAKILFFAGVQCEVRAAHIGSAKHQFALGAELWVRNAEDYQTAANLLRGLQGANSK